MSEEKKEEKTDKESAQTVPAHVQTPVTTTPVAATDAKEEKKVEPKKEKPSNCANCNKSIKKKRWYYRNGKFYCSHRCWKEKNVKAESPSK